VFSLSLRDVELLLAEALSLPIKFGQTFSNRLRRWRPRPGDKWYLDEVFIRIHRTQHYRWRAADQDGVVLDILVQQRRDLANVVPTIDFGRDISSLKFGKKVDKLPVR
jgi:putative transposase